MLITFKITNITCDACVKVSKAVLKGIAGVRRVEIEEDGLTTLESDREISWREISDTLAKVNKDASLI